MCSRGGHYIRPSSSPSNDQNHIILIDIYSYGARMRHAIVGCVHSFCWLPSVRLSRLKEKKIIGRASKSVARKSPQKLIKIKMSHFVGCWHDTLICVCDVCIRYDTSTTIRIGNLPCIIQKACVSCGRTINGLSSGYRDSVNGR